MSILSGITNLIFPNICLACEKKLITGEKTICLNCQLTLPKTNYHLIKDNPVEKHFWGITHIEAATALYHFFKKTRVQHMIHQLKYKGRQDIGIRLGKFFGIELLQSPIFSQVDIITAVPLHPLKQQKRGYNQSELICQGISETLQKPFLNNILRRSVNTQTQTKKHRIQRWQNVESVFIIPHPETIQNKHILLVDDVITTGSTLQACANQLLAISGTKVSIAALAHSEK